MANKPMASLMGLPRELRDDIIQRVLLGRKEAPRCPSNSIDRSKLQVREGDGTDFEQMDTHVLIENAPHTALLCVCRQLRYETRYAQSRLHAGDEYALDVMFVREAGLWPTWIYAPAPKQHVDTLYTSFRICGVPDEVREDWRSADQFRGGFRNIPAHAWGYFDLLAGYLQNGAGSRQVCRNTSTASFTVRKLIIDVLLPDLEHAAVMDHSPIGRNAHDSATRLSGDVFTTEDTLFARRGHWLPGWPRPRPSDPPNLFPADKLAYFLWSHICLLASLGAPYIKYGRILFDGVGTIEIRVGGKTRKEFELWTEVMRPIPRVGPGRPWPAPGEEWWRRLGEWKKDVVQRRRERGLQIM